MLAGGDPLRLPLDRFLNLIYYWLIKDADDEKQVSRLDLRLWMPPKGEAAPQGSPWSPEAETAAFRAFTAQVKGKSTPK